jgi:hypothetical protein
MFEITALHLEQWADTIAAESEFPRLVSRLIRETCRDLNKLDMPGGEHVRSGGFDGIVQQESVNQFVPQGQSAWELSARKDVTTKANEDYDKRTDNPRGISPHETHFLFATPRKWPGCDEWIKKKNKDKKWCSVRGLWSTHFEQWLDSARVTSAEFGREHLGKPTKGLRTLKMIWEDYADVPYKEGDTLPPSFVICGREEIYNEFMEWLESSPQKTSKIRKLSNISDERIEREDYGNMIIFSGNSKREVVDYIAASIKLNSDNEDAWNRWSETIFELNDQTTAESLIGIDDRYTILVTGKVVPPVMRMGHKYGCRIVFIQGNNSCALSHLKKFTLGPVSQHDMYKEVCKCGYSEKEVEIICRSAGYDYEKIRKQVFDD